MPEPPVESSTSTDDGRLQRRSIEPGQPRLENVLFVLVGVLIGTGVLYRAATIFSG